MMDNAKKFLQKLAYDQERDTSMVLSVFILENNKYRAFIEQLAAPVGNESGRSRLMAIEPKWQRE